MTEHATQVETETSETNNPETAHSEKTAPRPSSLPTIFSALAFLLAPLSLVSRLLGNKTVQNDPMQAVNAKLNQIENRIGDVELQITSDKLDAVDMQLKQILMNLKQLSRMADDATREHIERAYKELKPLVSRAHVKAEIDLQSAMAPENSSMPEAVKELSPSDIKPLSEDTKQNVSQPASDSDQPVKPTPPPVKIPPTQTNAL